MDVAHTFKVAAQKTIGGRCLLLGSSSPHLLQHQLPCVGGTLALPGEVGRSKGFYPETEPPRLDCIDRIYVMCYVLTQVGVPVSTLTSTTGGGVPEW